jgi:endonuclease YncB( thermonuclease family)
VALAIATIAASTSSSSVRAADACNAEPSETVKIARVVDGRTIQLADGRAIRLAGVELPSSATAREHARAVLDALLANRSITLSGASETADRYGRQTAFAVLPDSGTTVQQVLLAQGALLASGTVPDAGCAAELLSTEARARNARSGLWTGNVIKNAESPGDILAGIGQFGLVEGKVRSVRQAGGITYVNFGPRWTRDFAVTIPRRALSSFEQAGSPLKSLANRQVRVRGWVQRRGGPRIAVLRPGQIELLEKTSAARSRRPADPADGSSKPQ